MEYPLLMDKELAAMLDPLKNVKVSVLLANPLKEKCSNKAGVTNILISVAFTNSSIVNYVHLFNLEVLPLEEESA